MPGTGLLHDRMTTERRSVRPKTERSDCEEVGKDSPDDGGRRMDHPTENHPESVADTDKLLKDVASYADSWHAYFDASCYCLALRDGIAEDTRMEGFAYGPYVLEAA
jgi:hypothetical protein